MINTQKVKTLKNIVNLAMDLDVDRRSRKHEYVVARAMCYKILKEECNMSVTYIGRRFNKNHATIMHSLKEFPYMVKYDPTLNEIYNKILKKWLQEADKFVDIMPKDIKKELIELREKNNLLNLTLVEVKEELDKLKKDSETIRNNYNKHQGILKAIDKKVPTARLDEIERKIHAMLNGWI